MGEQNRLLAFEYEKTAHGGRQYTIKNQESIAC
jgi:hypothetical protein